MTAPVRRPGLVTLLVALAVLAGIGSVLTGVIAMIAEQSLLSAGLFPVIVGLIYFAVAKGLADGSPVARSVVAVLAVVQVVYAVITIINTDDAGTRSSAIGSGVLSLIILLILFAPQANAFFRSA